MSERLKCSLKNLIWPLMRLVIWALSVVGLLVMLRLGYELVVAVAVMGGALSVAHPIARWVQNAATRSLQEEWSAEATA